MWISVILRARGVRSFTPVLTIVVPQLMEHHNRRWRLRQYNFDHHLSLELGIFGTYYSTFIIAAWCLGLVQYYFYMELFDIIGLDAL